MERIEMVEKLREKANITLEEARTILENNNWDMLDAMIELERQGKITGGARAESGTEQTGSCETVNPTVMGEAFHEDQKEQEKKDRPAYRLKAAIRNLVRMGIDNQFVITRDEQVLARVPVILPIVCAIAAFWVTLGALFVGLLFNMRYSFEGKELGTESINNTMNKATDFAQGIVNNVKEETESDTKDEN